MIVNRRVATTIPGTLLMVLASFVCVAAEGPRPTLHKFLGIEMGYGTYSFDNKIDDEVVFPVANLTAGLAYQRYSAVLNVSGSMTNASVSEEDVFGDASRQDIDLTFGYQVHKNVSVFLGYKNGQTDFSTVNRESDIAGGNEYYKQNGPYVGVNLNWLLRDAGRIAFSIAYADLNASNKFISDGDGADEGEEKEFDDISGKSSGSSQGYSYNLSWTMTMRGNLLFRTRLRVNRYEQDIRFEGQTFSGVEENSSMLLVGITRIF
jgi:hypothetical protein